MNVKEGIKKELEKNPGEDKEILLWFLENIHSNIVWSCMTRCEFVKGERHWKATDDLLCISKGYQDETDARR